MYSDGISGELLEQRLELRERSVRVVEVAQHARHPARAELDGRAAKRGWRSNTPSMARQARNRSGEWCSTGKSLARRFSPPPSQSFGRGSAVVVERLGQQLAAADVQHERHAGFGEPGPDRLEVDVGGGEVAGRVRRHPDRGARRRRARRPAPRARRRDRSSGR